MIDGLEYQIQFQITPATKIQNHRETYSLIPHYDYNECMRKRFSLCKKLKQIKLMPGREEQEEVRISREQEHMLNILSRQFPSVDDSYHYAVLHTIHIYVVDLLVVGLTLDSKYLNGNVCEITIECTSPATIQRPSFSSSQVMKLAI